MNIKDRYISSSLMEKIARSSDGEVCNHFYNIFHKEADGKGIKNVTINSKGVMTFLPKGKECVLTYSEEWSKNNRQEGSYGKVLRKLLVENGVKVDKITDFNSRLELLVNKLKAEFTVEGTFKVVRGADITKYYLGDNYDYSQNLGTLSSSCMRHNGICQEATKFYAENENCEMLVLMAPNEDVIRGRALLWTDIEGRKFLDRIYSNDHIREAFKNYAKSNKWYHKELQDNCTGCWVKWDGSIISDIECRVEVCTDYDVRPYMDTIYFWGDGEISDSDDWEYEFTQQSEPEDDNLVWDDIDEIMIDREDSVWIEGRDITTHLDNTFYCELNDEYFLECDGVLCEGDLVYKESDDIVYIDSIDEHMYLDNVSYCDYNNEYYPHSEVDYIEDLEMSVHEDSVEDAYTDAGYIKVEDEYGEGVWVEKKTQLF